MLDILTALSRKRLYKLSKKGIHGKHNKKLKRKEKNIILLALGVYNDQIEKNINEHTGKTKGKWIEAKESVTALIEKIKK